MFQRHFFLRAMTSEIVAGMCQVSRRWKVSIDFRLDLAKLDRSPWGSGIQKRPHRYYTILLRVACWIRGNVEVSCGCENHRRLCGNASVRFVSLYTIHVNNMWLVIYQSCEFGRFATGTLLLDVHITIFSNQSASSQRPYTAGWIHLASIPCSGWDN